MAGDGLIESNRAHAGRVREDVWGVDYEPAKYDCDEYPFASTREGACTLTSSGTRTWHGSARPIDGDDDKLPGTWMDSGSYKVHRVLDGDPFVVKTDLRGGDA
ncbi:hypothetical protein [Saccharothrix longispora]|uniref:NucA/NucB deoxyribonuclease domain-containing protein n=1 Tax=Saccharothrix longispora TaxID=33920 RepID=UPI0028FCFD46|nr:hypothetical protein [Saccharothrix longispora]MDU0287727.1 hypothetical protein [Saccharothrix longispora]